MAAETSPAFQFYVKEWRSSRAIMRMTFAQRGMYLEMLLEQWESGSLPDCPTAVAHLLGGTVEEWEAAWPTIRRKFVDRRHPHREFDPTAEHDANRSIVNLKLEQVRKELRRFKITARKGGQARAKSAKRRKDGTYYPAGEPAAQPAAIQPPTSTASATATPTATATTRAVAPSKRPIFKGQRLTVFEWMLDECVGILGAHFEAFDLHSWFFDLDSRAVELGQVIPQNGGWPWLQAQLVAEARRRGLKLEIVAVGAKKPEPASNVPNASETKRYLDSIRGPAA